MDKAVFLDRDGVINSDVGHYYIYKPEHFKLNQGVIDALKIWKSKGYVFIVITNQGGIARGTYTISDVERVHKKFLSLMNENDIHIKEIYVCPHHDKFEKCLCRKPDSLNFEKAIARFSIDRSKSYMVGDNVKDVVAAEKTGLKGIKIESNQSLLSIIDRVK